MTSKLSWALLVTGSLTAAGCLQVLGLGDYRDGATGGSASTSTTSPTTSTMGSASGGAGGGPVSCTPGQSYPCYDGPPGSDKNGICHGGMHVCDNTGLGFGVCTGEQLPQTEVCSMKGDEDCDGYACSETMWSQALMGSDIRIAVAPDGSAYLAFDFGGSIQIGSTTLVATANSDLGIAKFDPKGVPVWAKAFGTAHRDLPGAIAADANGVAVMWTAGGPGDTFPFGGNQVDAGLVVLKLDTNGNETWARSCHDATLLGQFVGGIAIDPTGSVSVGTASLGQVDCGGGPIGSAGITANLVVARFSATGVYQWAHAYPSIDNNHSVLMSGLATDSAGSVLFTGRTNSPLKFGTNFGDPTLMPNGVDLFVAKLTPGGGHSYSALFGDAAEQGGQGIGVDSSGAAYVAGEFQGSMVIGATTLSASQGDTQAFLMKLNSSGQPVWAKEFGAAGTTHSAQAIAVDSKGPIITGYMGGPADFGAGPLVPNGTGLFVAALDGAGALRWQRFLAPNTGFWLGLPGVYSVDASANASGVLGLAGRFDDNPTDFGSGPIPGPGRFFLEIAP